MLAGTASVKVTAEAAELELPLLLTTAVMVKLDPGATVEVDVVFVTLRSADAATPVPDRVRGWFPALS